VYEYITIIIASIWITINLISGAFLWTKRKEVPDRSRTYLSLICFILALGIPFFIIAVIKHDLSELPTQLLQPFLTIGGLWGITMFVCYPIEVIRPRGLRGRWLALLFLPSLLVTLPTLFGLQFHELHSWADLWAHIGSFDVLLRLLSLALLTCISLIMLFIPYNWRKSSADYQWIRRTTLIAQGITILFYANVLTNQPIFYYLHILWCLCAAIFLFYYELVVRLLPPDKKVALSSEHLSAEEAVGETEDEHDYWPRICQVMDEWEEWRNPNTTVETVSRSLGTNRYYVGRCIREHTGLTFNDYMNQKRIDFMAAQLRRDPQQDHKTLYFEAGFRSRTAAYRNFVKFIGCSPTDFVATL